MLLKKSLELCIHLCWEFFLPGVCCSANALLTGLGKHTVQTEAGLCLKSREQGKGHGLFCLSVQMNASEWR